MRNDRKPNPKKDRSARRKARPDWKPAKVTGSVEYREVIVKGSDGREHKQERRILINK